MTWYDDAMRTIVDLPDAQRDVLDAWCRREGISRAEAVRRAIAAHVRAVPAETPDPAYGLWSGRVRDGLTYERRLRREWDAARPTRRVGRPVTRSKAGAKTR
jgi:hypothetical protein